MTERSFQRQTPEKPLFPNLLWSRPENKRAAGKLLIVGGHAYTFAAPANGYVFAQDAGIGSARVLLPDSLRKITGHILEEVEFAPSTPSGSFSSKSLAQLLDEASWADGVLLAGDFGRNSETAILLEKFMQKYDGFVTLTKDAADYIVAAPKPVLARPRTILVITMAQLQRIAIQADFIKPFTFSMDLLRLVEALELLTSTFPVSIVVKQRLQIITACNGETAVTTLTEDTDAWRLECAARAAVWTLQHPSQPFESITTAVFELCGSADFTD